MSQVAIIDTGCANITSVRCAFERICDDVVVTRDTQLIRNASHVVLPGVGTAGAAMGKLTSFELIEFIQSLTQPVLGICLGMQLLTNASEERNVDCLGIVDAKVSAMKNSHNLPLPHMGWNQLTDLKAPLFNDIPAGSYVYFVHSFAVPVGDYTLAQSDYGQAFSASINRDNFYGVQFHPERSGKIGAQILRNFLAISQQG
ncbi:imidazole glycerol phosphate synthase subunit HisH [Psychrobium sp. MM17-31]|uniref:imidazole glycerol phosphate synthase subunit HisH n=1 Tax=Psychrobium sp. MM17-31 TaxID=2917758 RepID=UPI001EF54AAF|nr:imidazole glycerol phosphate synthase subunit HisH [Psychrobium sp. MM17-31]MCG7531857.1 imidazole glycerol phosphate synthase subunit HisH [Psychrobium sp. MM17-31]